MRSARAALSESRPIPRRGLSREEAAIYFGIGTNKLDEMVTDGRAPRPRRIDGRKVWDIRELDIAFDALPKEDALPVSNSWKDA